MIYIRTRNIKLNIFLNEEEKHILVNKSKKANLSQSEFLRMLIIDYSDNRMLNKDVNEIVISLTNVCNELERLSNKLNRLCYYSLTSFLDKQINDIKKVIDKVQK